MCKYVNVTSALLVILYEKNFQKSCNLRNYLYHRISFWYE